MQKSIVEAKVKESSLNEKESKVKEQKKKAEKAAKGAEAKYKKNQNEASYKKYQKAHKAENQSEKELLNIKKQLAKEDEILRTAKKNAHDPHQHAAKAAVRKVALAKKALTHAKTWSLKAEKKLEAARELVRLNPTPENLAKLAEAKKVVQKAKEAVKTAAKGIEKQKTNERAIKRRRLYELSCKKKQKARDLKLEAAKLTEKSMKTQTRQETAELDWKRLKNEAAMKVLTQKTQSHRDAKQQLSVLADQVTSASKEEDKIEKHLQTIMKNQNSANLEALQSDSKAADELKTASDKATKAVSAARLAARLNPSVVCIEKLKSATIEQRELKVKESEQQSLMDAKKKNEFDGKQQMKLRNSVWTSCSKAADEFNKLQLTHLHIKDQTTIFEESKLKWQKKKAIEHSSRRASKAALQKVLQVNNLCHTASTTKQTAQTCLVSAKAYLDFYKLTLKRKVVELCLQEELQSAIDRVSNVNDARKKCPDRTQRHQSTEIKWKEMLKQRELEEKESSTKLREQVAKADERRRKAAQAEQAAEKAFKVKPDPQHEKEWTAAVKQQQVSRDAFTQIENQLVEEEDKRKRTVRSGAISKQEEAKIASRKVKSCGKASEMAQKWFKSVTITTNQTKTRTARARTRVVKAKNLQNSVQQRLMAIQGTLKIARQRLAKATTTKEDATRRLGTAKARVTAANDASASAKDLARKAKEELQTARDVVSKAPTTAAISSLKQKMAAFKDLTGTLERANQRRANAEASMSATEQAVNVANKVFGETFASTQSLNTRLENAQNSFANSQVAIQTTKETLSQRVAEQTKAAESVRKAMAALKRISDRCNHYQAEEQKAKEQAQKAAEKARLGEREKKSKGAMEKAQKQKNEELMKKANAKTMEQERKFKASLEARKKEEKVKAAEQKNKQEVQEKKQKEIAKKELEKRTKEEKVKQVAKKKADEIAEKQRLVRLRKMYAEQQGNGKKFPVVCVTEDQREKYSPASPPVNSVILTVLNELLTQMKESGHYPAGTGFPQAKDNVSNRLKDFQKRNNIDDAAGCVSKNTWRALMATCPFPMTMALCHEPRACVLAVQKVLFRWLPDGKYTARFCKQTKIQVMKFQRRTQSYPMDGVTLNPSGKVFELDFITLLRRHGVRDSRDQDMGVTAP